MSGASKAEKLCHLFSRQNGRCIWCGVQMELLCGEQKADQPQRATFEHFYNRLSPLRRKYGNVVFAACSRCNSTRGRFDQMLANRGIDIADVWIRPNVKRLTAA